MSEPHATQITILQPETLVGTWRRFGLVGPVYEIIGVGRELADHDRMMRVRDIRAFRVEQWSDFTNLVKGP
jgi:hypothetical protein